MARSLAGGCFCGAVRYRLRAEPLIVNCCHCLQCQAQTGSAFAVNALIEASKLEARGPIQVVRMSARGEFPHDLHRCRRCKVALWSDYGRGPLRFVKVGTLDDPTAAPPQAHIFIRSKQPWVALPRGVPAFEEGYDRNATWPAKSLARREAAVAAWKKRR